MAVYNPLVPTGTVPFNIDYANVQGNFLVANISFGTDHYAFSDSTSNNGYHNVIHLVNGSLSTPPVLGTGELFTVNTNDGISTRSTLYWQSSVTPVIQMTRNFAPTVAANGRTFLPGGMILQWGSTTAVQSSTGITVNYPFAFPTAVYSVQCQVVTNDNSTIRFSLKGNASTTGFVTTQNSTSSFINLYWIAIGV
jgi:hypothetical protein